MQKLELYVAIPDSTLIECSDLREKTEKVGYIARACAIHGVSRIYIYHDKGERAREDQRLLSILLQYIETPQYLRRRLFPRIHELAYAGILPPLRTPSHLVTSETSKVKVGDLREGYCYRRAGDYYVDLGLEKPALLVGGDASLGRVLVRVEGVEPELTCMIANRSLLKEYWGYTVKQTEEVSKLVKSLKPVTVIATSRQGQPLEEYLRQILDLLRSSERCLILFGSPRRGLKEILRDEKTALESIAHMTIRTEEALYIVLGIINLLAHIRTL